MLKLIKPNEIYYNQYKEMMDEWNMEGSRIAPWILNFKYHKKELFNEMLKRVKASQLEFSKFSQEQVDKIFKAAAVAVATPC